MSYSKIQNRSLPRFSGVKTFFRCSNESLHVSESDVLICGVPFDGGTTYRSGARMAPARVREVSSLGRGYHLQRDRDVFESIKVADGGDISINPLSMEKTYMNIEKEAYSIWKRNQKLLTVGGDHSISLPLLRTAVKVHGPLNFLHFDAHFDTYPAAYGSEYHHGSFLRHAVDEGLIKSAWQFGIRGPLVVKKDKDFFEKINISVFTMDALKTHGKNILSQLSFKMEEPSYIRFDVDCLDPAYATGTGTPVVGGLTSYEVQQIFRHLPIKNLVGADVVEVNPLYDHGDITSLVAVDAMFECLHLMSIK